MSSCGLTKYNKDLNEFKANAIVKANSSHNKLKDQGTEVHIVGTMHFETDQYSRLDLYNYIDSISPSVILSESTTRTMKRILNKNHDFYFRILNARKDRNDIERPVSLRYIENYPNCRLLPYEWELRNKYHRKHKLVKKSKYIINTIIRLGQDQQLDQEGTAIVNRFLKLYKHLLPIEEKASIYDINTISMDNSLRERQKYAYDSIPQLGIDRVELADYADFLPIHMAYWDTRNKAMVANILKQIKLNPNKVIVVMNGYYHRYYLIEELRKYETEYDFTVH